MSMLTMAIFDQYQLTAEVIKHYITENFEGLINVNIISDSVSGFQFKILTEKPDIILIDNDFIYDDMVCLLDEMLDGYQDKDEHPLIIIMHTTNSSMKRQCILDIMKKSRSEICFVKKPIAHGELSNCVISNLIHKLDNLKKEFKKILP